MRSHSRSAYTKIVITIFALVFPFTNASRPVAAARAVQPSPGHASVTVPVAFVENRGQTDPRVRYYARGDRFGFFLMPGAVTVALDRRDASGPLALSLRFVGANPTPRLEAAGPAGEANYFHGSDPAAWRTRVPQYTAVVYRGLWPGIDLHVREQAGVLKYEFHVHPGGRASDVRVAYDGASSLAIDASGALLIRTPKGTLEDSAPVAYQPAGDVRIPIDSTYQVTGKGRGARVGFTIGGGYDPRRDLVIDPGIQFTTFLGGGSAENGTGIVVDAAGNTYITGTTQSPDFPTTAGAFDRTGAAQNFAEAFITKLNASGTALIYSTFIGGSNMEFGRRIAIDAAGQRLHYRHDQVVQLPGHRKRLRPFDQHPAELSALQDRSDGRVRY